MKPHLAALVAGPFALPGWFLGLFLIGAVMWILELLGFPAHFGGLGRLLLEALLLVLFAGVPLAVAGGVYLFVAHGEERPFWAGFAGVLVGVVGSVALLVAELPFSVSSSRSANLVVLLLAGALLGSAAALAAGSAATRRVAAEPSR